LGTPKLLHEATERLRWIAADSQLDPSLRMALIALAERIRRLAEEQEARGQSRY
jgi:hypothetical protein